VLDIRAPCGTPEIPGRRFRSQPGLVRAAGSLEILIAGYAIANDATVLTADHDFDHIATVSDLQHEYIAPSP
jgi:predicted PilT family ATPase